MATTSYAIWVSKNSKDQGFTVWASPAPNYSIPQTLEEGITKFQSFVADNDFLPGTGTWLCGFESEREMILGQMSAEGVISWNNPEWENRVIEQEKTADDLAWEEACRADDEAWQNGQDKLIEQIVKARNLASLKIQAEKVEQVTGTTLPTVSSTVKGDIPSLFSNWVIIASTTYNAKYGDKYTVLATKSKDSQNFLDIICDTNNNYITLGSEKYSKTVEIAERMSLLAEADRLGL